MDINRLSQENNTPKATRTHRAGKDWKRVKDRQEELRTISPLFQKLESQRMHEPDPQEWKTFSHKLAARLDRHKAPLSQTVQDRLTATDGHLLRWFWIIVALILLSLIAAAIMISLGTSPGLTLEAALLPMKDLPCIVRTDAEIRQV